MKILCMEDMLPAIKEQPEIRMNEQAANLLQLTLAKIHCRNEIVAVSGFRTQEEQEKYGMTHWLKVVLTSQKNMWQYPDIVSIRQDLQ